MPSVRTALLVLSTLAALAAPLPAQAPGPERMALLSRGINLNNAFAAWADPRSAASRFGAHEAAFLKKAGFSCVRLPLGPSYLYDPDRPGTPRAEPLAALDRTLRLLLDAGLAVVFDPVHGGSADWDWERRLHEDPAFRAGAEAYWEALARHCAAISADRVFFEIMNEPHLNSKDKTPSSWWAPAQAGLAAAVRRGAPGNTIVATGELWGGIDGLLGIEPLADPNVVYSFHYYNPFVFTHQGATWTSPVQAFLSGVPYPADPARVSAAEAATENPEAKGALRRYAKEGWNRARVEADLDRVQAWAAKWGAAVFCGEFGTYRKAAPAADRLAWLRDVRESLEARRMGWAMWDYENDFGLVSVAEKQWRRGLAADSACLEALGLDPAATLADPPGAPSFADFASGKAASIALPPDAWGGLWTRESGAGTKSFEAGGAGSVGLELKGSKDWAMDAGFVLPVKEGEIYELSARARLDGPGNAVLAAVAKDGAGKVLQWSFGQVRLPEGKTEKAEARLVVPAGVATLAPRFSGNGPAVLVLETLTITRLPPAQARTVLSNERLELSFEARTGAFSVLDKRGGTRWTQTIPSGPAWAATRIDAGAGKMRAELSDGAAGRRFALELSLDGAEVALTLEGDGELPGDLRYPYPWKTVPGSSLVVPLNEGIRYPADDPAAGEQRLPGYGGHGLCMSFWGIDLGKASCLSLLETPDDASLELKRQAGLLGAGVAWQGQKGQWGYKRSLRLVFQAGGEVAMAKRYRAYAESRGTLVTLKRKKEKNPNVDRLLGAADVWYWGRDAREMAGQLKAAGMDKVLWSVEEEAPVLAELNALGWLTGRYDLYQDVMDPAQFPRLRWVHPAWPTSAWPASLVRDQAGNLAKGWEVEAKDGSMVACGVLSDQAALPLARERIGADLAKKPYLARFIDTTTASPWREDWSAGHPLTRSGSRAARMDLLDLVSGEMGLVAGSETGHDAAVPYVHYFEGMMSLGPYRIADAGRNMQRIVEAAPEQVARFQLGWKYRIPLWELVYHDAVVAYWYWGDYSNKFPALWKERDLFNALYGTPPVYMFDAAFWKANRDRFAESYRIAAGTAKATAYAEMTDFAVLSPDRSVQRAVFGNGRRATVNFGDRPWTLEDGKVLGPGSALLE